MLNQVIANLGLELLVAKNSKYRKNTASSTAGKGDTHANTDFKNVEIFLQVISTHFQTRKCYVHEYKVSLME